MDTYDLSHKLAYAGARSPVPFITGPEFTNSVPGIPVLAALRVFIPPAFWSEENVIIAAREIARVLGPGNQFDVGITVAGRQTYEATRAAAGNVARLMKMEPGDPTIVLRMVNSGNDTIYQAHFPSLRFEPVVDDYWRTTYSTGAVKVPTQQ